MTNRSKGMSRWISISALGVGCLMLAVFMVMGIDSWVSGHLSTDDPKDKGEKPFEATRAKPKADSHVSLDRYGFHCCLSAESSGP